MPMYTPTTRTTGFRFAKTLATCVALVAAIFTNLAVADEWPEKPISIVVPFKAGGSADRMARTLTTPLANKLGVPVTVANKPGGSGALGATYVAHAKPDGQTLLLMQATPYLANTILIGKAPFAWSDYTFLNAQWNDFAIVAVHKDSPYKTFAELIAAMKTPGKLSSGIIYGNGGHLQTLMLTDALDIPRDNIRYVSYDGGSPLRTALAGNQVDFEILAARGAKSIRDKLRILAVVDQPKDGIDAPSMNDELAKMGVAPLPVIGGNISGLLVPTKFKSEYPYRYQRLLSAYKSVVQSDDYKAAAKKAGVGADWVGQEKSQVLVNDAYKALSKYASIVK